MVIIELSIDDINSAVTTALGEDFGSGDITSDAVIPKSSQIKLVMVPRQDIVLAGLPIAAEVFKRLTPDAIFSFEAIDGSLIKAGEIIARIQGPAAAILSGERTALNMVQTLSGIATLTRSFVDQIRGTEAILLDTRKTFPGLRNLSKYCKACCLRTSENFILYFFPWNHFQKPLQILLYIFSKKNREKLLYEMLFPGQ